MTILLSWNRHWPRLAIALLLSLTAASAQPQATGSNILRLVVPFAAGSYTDNVARIIAPAIGEQLRRTVVVENRAGANGIIGADIVAKAPADGNTLLVGGISVNSINPGLYKSLPYDPVRDLLPVARIGILPFLLVVHPDVPVKTVRELIAHAKQHPGKLSYATPNAATLVGMETFKRVAGIDIVGINYKSSPQAMTDLAGNHVQVLIADFATAMPQVRAGKARLLAVTMAHRSALLPDVPTVGESVDFIDLAGWTGLLAPGGTSPAFAKEVAQALAAALETPEVKERFRLIDYDARPLGPEQFAPFVRAEIENWKQLIKAAGVQPQ